MSDDMMRLVEPLIPALRRYARALLRDAVAADDLVQDCLERVIGRWHQHRADGNARTWVFTILHNLAVNRLKQSARRGAVRIWRSTTRARPLSPGQRARRTGCAIAICCADCRACRRISAARCCSCRSKTCPMPKRRACSTSRSAR